MALKYKVGDICDALESGEVVAIGHQANCFNTMNSGVAKAIRKRWPIVYEVDCETTKGDISKLGTFTVAEVGGRVTGFGASGAVYNLYGQYNYGYDAKGYTSYSALTDAMSEMRLDLLEYYAAEGSSIGFPKIGAGLGGGDWTMIEAIISEVFADFDVTIYTLN